MNKIIGIDGLFLNSLKVIRVAGGDVIHGMKKSDFGYKDFGEAYFSKIDFGAIKGWKRHNLMTLNLMVPHGGVKFVFYDGREHSLTHGRFQELVLSKKEFARITVPPGIWFGFQGIEDSENIVLNIASIEHDQSEVDRLPLNSIDYNW